MGIAILYGCEVIESRLGYVTRSLHVGISFRGLQLVSILNYYWNVAKNYHCVDRDVENHGTPHKRAEKNSEICLS